MPNGNIAPGSLRWEPNRKYPVVQCADCGAESSAAILGKGVHVAAVLDDRPTVLPDTVALSLPTSHKCVGSGEPKAISPAKASTAVSRPVSLADFAKAIEAEIEANRKVLADIPKRAESLRESILKSQAELDAMPDREAALSAAIENRQAELEKVKAVL